MRRPAVDVERELAAPLREAEEEREEAGAADEPPREEDVDGHRTGRRPDHEERCDREDVEENDVFQDEGVRGLEGEKPHDERDGREIQDGRETDGDPGEYTGDSERERRRQLPRGDGSHALQRMRDGRSPTSCTSFTR